MKIHQGILSYCLDRLLCFIETLWFALCASVVVASLLLKEHGFIGRFLWRMTLISGKSEDTNARLCLFLRTLYTLAPPPFTFDAKEVFFGQIFLTSYHKAFIWLIRVFGMRAVPPLLRPIYVTYQVRADQVAKFINKCILSSKVMQVVIIGAGFDTSALRMRPIRIDPSSDRYVTYFEIDRGRVQREKIRLLREALTETEYSYFLEGVRFVECELGTDSLCECLIQSGFNPHQSTAIVWEGVTYYLTKDDVRSTLEELYVLLHNTKPLNVTTEWTTSSSHTTPSGLSIVTPLPYREDSSVLPSPKEKDETIHQQDSVVTNIQPENTTSELNDDSPEMRSETMSVGCRAEMDLVVSEQVLPCDDCTTATTATVATKQQPLGECYLMLDYMKELKREKAPWIWRKCLELFDVSGNSLQTSFTNIKECLEPYKWQVISSKTSLDTIKEITHLNNPYFKVLIDVHTVVATCEPMITTVECKLNRSTNFMTTVD